MFRIIVAVAAVVTVLALVGVASAGGAHYTKGGAPTFTDNGDGTGPGGNGTLTANGELAGMGSSDVVVDLAAPATVTGTGSCSNPGNGTQPTGRNPVSGSASTAGQQLIPGSTIHNGRSTFSVTTAPLPSTITIAGAPDCSNSLWTETITNITVVAFTGATLTIRQGGATVLTGGCTFSSPTTNNTVSC